MKFIKLWLHNASRIVLVVLAIIVIFVVIWWLDRWLWNLRLYWYRYLVTILYNQLVNFNRISEEMSLDKVFVLLLGLSLMGVWTYFCFFYKNRK